MRLEKLKLENFRGFESATLSFHPEVTVLVGANGSGKTSVLDAIVLVLTNLLAPQQELRTHDGVRTMHATDYRSGTTGASVIVGLEHEDLHENLESRLKVVFDDSGHIREATRTYRPGVFDQYYENSESRDSVPIVCYYDVERHARDSTPRSRDAVYRTPKDAWNDAWSAQASFHELFQWFREREDIENAERVEQPSFRDSQLVAVRSAIEALLPGYTRPRVRRPRGAAPMELKRPALVITKDHEELAFDQLSGGERTLVALAGDIARRLAIANPTAENPLDGEGVVLIDEVDLHLHPRWQAEVVPALRRAFPNLQLVLTTHSLVVLSYVPSECVHLLKDFEVYDAPTPTEGREPNALATELYGIPLRPPSVSEEIARISELIYHEHFDEARKGLEQLAEDLGDHDTDVVRLTTTLALEEV